MADGPHGTGAGWRPEIAAVLDAADELGFVEVIAESVRPDDLPAPLLGHARRGAVIPHGVRLSLGGTEPVDGRRVSHLAACAEAVDAPLVSEHVSFVRAGGREAGHLLPLPRTRDALDVLAANIARVRTEVDVPIAVEPIAALFDWPEDEFDEAGFLTRLLDRTGALLLLDVANVHANARNRGRDPREVLDALPLDRVAYCHVAGGADHDGFYHDTHTDPTPDEVLDLLAHVVDRHPGLPVMLERDGRYPPAAELRAELAAIARVAGHAPPPADRPASPADRTAPPTDRAASQTDRPAPVSRRTPPAGAAPPTGVPHPSQPVRHAEKGCAAPHTGTVSESADTAGRQAALVDALVADGPDPDGVDARRLAATRAALLRKRAGLAAKEWPRLAAALGDGWQRTFADRFAGIPPTDALREGWDLARELRGRGELPAGAVAELDEREATLRYDGRTPPTRRARLVAAARRRLARS
ncbi:DUF692 domain-containing protein [Pseudonocardia endophytica]|uniref:Uncharacterized protein (UPF0276 family) n=1 Tax=Pseudonocardia endophytica TaxID=401976 RepID=A0A4R1HI21_PSEEN|nr:DUF692 domain-containing protein [Pseudonocardia endophytica]TCK20483.1 uncharacterized protein (UPF0276 family) [Pseudonocardia endophytica]